MRAEKKSVILSILLFNSSVLFASFASVKVIYGEDGREDLVHVLNPEFRELAKSTAAMIPDKKIVELNSEQINLGGSTLEEGNICSSERFVKQPTAANCSGFLVGEDILVTAGHCIKGQADCDSNSWVFDYKVDYATQSEVVVDKKNVYKCKEVLSRSLDSATKNDYAVIKLTRKVEDRNVLKMRKSGSPSVGQGLVVIGHPSGLPTKVTSGAIIRSINKIFMVTNLDTYGGNSGSAVFNSVTGEVEGILVRGDADYKWDDVQGCRVSNTLGERDGRGEDVTLISVVEGIPEQLEDEETPPVDVIAPKPSAPAWWLRFLEWLRRR